MIKGFSLDTGRHFKAILRKGIPEINICHECGKEIEKQYAEIFYEDLEYAFYAHIDCAKNKENNEFMRHAKIGVS